MADCAGLWTQTAPHPPPQGASGQQLPNVLASAVHGRQRHLTLHGCLKEIFVPFATQNYPEPQPILVLTLTLPLTLALTLALTLTLALAVGQG